MGNGPQAIRKSHFALRNCALLFVLTFIAAGASSPAHAQKAPAAVPDSDCLACHGQSDLKSGKGRSVFVDPEKHKTSIHADVSCTSCHADIKEFPHPAKIAKVNCAACHEGAVADFKKGIHSVLGPEACQSCHGPAHYAQPASTIRLAQCAQCHETEVKQFETSIHAAAVRNGDSQAPPASRATARRTKFSRWRIRNPAWRRETFR